MSTPLTDCNRLLTAGDDERRAGAEPREYQTNTSGILRDANRAARTPRIADQTAVNRHDARRIAVLLKVPGIHGGDRLVTLGDASDGLCTHDLVVGEHGLQIHPRVEPQRPDRNRPFGVDERRAVKVIQKDARREDTRLGEIDLLRRDGRERQKQEPGGNYREAQSRAQVHAPILRN